MIGSRKLNELADLAGRRKDLYDIHGLITVMTAMHFDSQRLQMAEANRELIKKPKYLAEVIKLLDKDVRLKFVEEQEQFWAQQLKAEINAKEPSLPAEEHEVIFNPASLSEDEHSEESSKEKREREMEVEDQRPQKKAAVANQGIFGNSRATQLARLQEEANTFINNEPRRHP